MRCPRHLALVLGAVLVACSAPQATAPTPDPGASADPNRALPNPLPEVAARINGHPISSASVAVLAHQYLLTKAFSAKQKPLAMRKALERLVDRELLVQEALARNLKADERGLQRAYDAARVSYKQDQAWREYLAGEGLDEATFLAELRSQFTVNALTQQEAQKLPPPTEDELRAYYAGHPLQFGAGERLRVSQILFKTPEKTDPRPSLEPLRRAQEALARIRKGEDFAKVAREVSEDRESAAKGGEIAIFGKGEKPEEYEKAAFALEDGGVSDELTTNAGIFILKRHQATMAPPAPFEQVLEQVGRLAFQERVQHTMEALVASLKAKARIETYL
jgi:parvulin-like peptidyl-prolyl isomerase